MEHADVAMVVEGAFADTLKRQVEKGAIKYGVRLHTWNGRDAAKDVREELVDAFQYMTQLQLERDEYARVLAWFAITEGFWDALPLEIKDNMNLILPDEFWNKLSGEGVL